jgi:drug/metabolite transporter, DME family
MSLSPSRGRVAAPSRVAEGFGLLILTGIIWGTIGVASKQVGEETALDPVAVSWLRTMLATPLCLALGWRAHGGDLLRAGRRDLALMAFLGVVLIVYQWLYLAAVERLGVSAATLISLCGSPVVIAIVSVALLDEPLTGRTAGALVGALAGTALVVGWDSGASAGEGSALLGTLLAIGSAGGIAAHALVSRRLAGRQPTWRPLAIGFPAGAIAFVPIAAGSGLTFDLPTSSWLLLLYLAIGPSVLAYWFYQHALRDVPATTASIVILLEPVVAALLAWVLFGERLGLVGLAGGALLLGSIWWLIRPNGESGVGGRGSERMPRTRRARRASPVRSSDS